MLNQKADISVCVTGKVCINLKQELLNHSQFFTVDNQEAVALNKKLNTTN